MKDGKDVYLSFRQQEIIWRELSDAIEHEPNMAYKKEIQEIIDTLKQGD